MLLSFDQIHQYEILLSDIKAIRQEPSYRTFVSNGRICNGFLYIKKGTCKYEYTGGEISLAEGSVIYLPFGSRHTLTITSKDTCFYRIDFTLRVQDKIVLFSNHPLKITDYTPPSCLEAIENLANDYGMEDNSIKRTQNLCILLSELQNISVSPLVKRLMPAINYLQKHILNDVNCSTLAKLCFLGTSRFYSLFKSEFGMTPLEYRNRILIRKATSFLSSNDITVKETAFALGFESTTYFSRFFKRHMGMTPTEYIKSKHNSPFNIIKPSQNSL